MLFLGQNLKPMFRLPIFFTELVNYILYIIAFDCLLWVTQCECQLCFAGPLEEGPGQTDRTMPDATIGEDDFDMWELVWAKSKVKDDWWPCQICEVICFICESILLDCALIKGFTCVFTKSNKPGRYLIRSTMST